MRRVIGILTQANEWARELEENPERELHTAGIVTQLLGDVMPPITLPADAGPEQIGAVLSREVGRVVQQLTEAFSLAFVELSRAHDAGRTDITSTDILRDLALRTETEWPDD